MVIREFRCPVCQRRVSWEGNPDRPFCGERCRLIDLGAWASDEYKVPGESLPDEQYSDSAPSITDN